MYCNEFFRYLPQRLLYLKPHCTHTVDLLMTVSTLALALHMLLYVCFPPRLDRFWHDQPIIYDLKQKFKEPETEVGVRN